MTKHKFHTNDSGAPKARGP